MTLCAFLTGELYILGGSLLLLVFCLRFFRPKGGNVLLWFPWLFSLFGAFPLELGRFLAGLDPAEPAPLVMAAVVVLELIGVCCCFQGPWYRNFMVELSAGACLSLTGAVVILLQKGAGMERFTYAAAPEEVPAFLLAFAGYLLLSAAGLALLGTPLPRVLESRWLRGTAVVLFGVNLVFCIAAVCQSASLEELRELLRGDRDPLQILVLLTGAVFPGLLALLALKVLLDERRHRGVEEENRRLDRLLEQQLQYYLSLEEARGELRRLRHDMANHLQTVRSLVERGEAGAAGQYAGQLSAACRQVPAVELCENLVVNAVLAECWRRCQREEIALECRVSCPAQVELRGVDLMCVFSNLLDNAVEACLQLGPGEERAIRCEAGIRSGCLWVRVENTAPPPEGEDRWRSRKGAEGHGLGLDIVERVAARCRGELRRESPEEGLVRLTLLLPLPAPAGEGP